MSPTLKFKHFNTVPWFQFINLFLVTPHCMLTTVCCINEVCIHILILKVSYVLISLVYSLYVCRFCILWGRFYFVTVEWEFVSFFPHETECKPIVVCYPRLLLCLEQTLSFVWQSSMAWNMLHGLKTKEQGKQPWDKTKRKRQLRSGYFRSTANRQAVNLFYRDIEKTYIDIRPTYCNFSGAFNSDGLHLLFKINYKGRLVEQTGVEKP